MRKRAKLPPPLTGTSTRMKALPYANVSSVENYNDQMYEFSRCEDLRIKNLLDEESQKGPFSRKCVYTYEDKYAFSRIIFNDSLLFDSHFESGNLHSAFRVLTNSEISCAGVSFRKHVYDLYMHNDLYTSGNTQWFYFRVSNARIGQEVTFHFKNFLKPESLFNEGMRPLFFSSKSGKGWERCGIDIRYYSSHEFSNRDSSRLPGEQINASNKELFCCSFSHTFLHNEDLCYFSFCLPYTYTDLNRLILKIQEDPRTSRLMKKQVLCKTIAGNDCHLLTITAPAISPEQLNRRVVIILTARVHPGESNSSWIMQGIISFLLSDCDAAAEMRKCFVIKIIPMLNPDGVINGNYRTSLAGCDLNRKWSKPDPNRHPTIFWTKELIKRLKRQGKCIGFILDFHGHSRKQGIFLYGCVPEKRLLYLGGNSSKDSKDEKKHAVAFSGGFQTNECGKKKTRKSDVAQTSTRTNFGNFVMDMGPSVLPSSLFSPRDLVVWRVKLLPRIMNVVTPYFSFDDCSYKMHKSKSGTMRIVAFTELGIDCVYTVEASLAGSDCIHFGPQELLRMGHSICLSLLAAFPIFANNDELRQTYSVSGLYDEILAWRPYYDPSVYFQGANLLSEAALQEMIEGGDEQYTDDSDNDTIALERATRTAKRVRKKGDIDTEKKINSTPPAPIPVPAQGNVSSVQSEFKLIISSCDKKEKLLDVKDATKKNDVLSKPRAKANQLRRPPKPVAKRPMEITVIGAQSSKSTNSSGVSLSETGVGMMRQRSGKFSNRAVDQINSGNSVISSSAVDSHNLFEDSRLWSDVVNRYLDAIPDGDMDFLKQKKNRSVKGMENHAKTIVTRLVNDDIGLTKSSNTADKRCLNRPISATTRKCYDGQRVSPSISFESGPLDSRLLDPPVVADSDECNSLNSGKFLEPQLVYGSKKSAISSRVFLSVPHAELDSTFVAESTVVNGTILVSNPKVFSTEPRKIGFSRKKVTAGSSSNSHTSARFTSEF